MKNRLMPITKNSDGIIVSLNCIEKESKSGNSTINKNCSLLFKG